MARADTNPADLKKQAYIMYSVGMSMIVLRMLAQINRVGWRRISWDDYVMILSGVS